MWIGDLVADRFVIERPIGAGGMGSIYIASDRVAGGQVAVKVLELASEGAVERFRREASVLSDLFHPGIVRYVAHGETSKREPFLAMEVLEGEDLGQRLANGGLAVEESLTLVRKVAEALSFAHDRGIVHRDVKPSNLFLVKGDVERVKVLDFGIARATLETQALTQTGAMLGTVGYMAPEQATGSRDVDARADVFALGCVLFECLTGRAAFTGDHAVAILAKVLHEEAPKISDLRPGLGLLDSLVGRMLAKQPADRPENAAEIVKLLRAIDAAPIGSARPQVSRPRGRLTHSEQKVVSVILGERVKSAAALRTAMPEPLASELERLRELATRFGAEFTPLQGGALLFVLSGKGTANDQAIRAASLALAIHRILPECHFAIATGRAETTSRMPVGAAIDRTAAILRSASKTAEPVIMVDDVTAALLGSRFDVRGEILVGHASEIETHRVLLGKTTPTVGREKEMAFFEATLAECIDDSVARMVLITAPPGGGKSRLATELIERVRRGGTARVLLTRGEALGGSPLVPSLLRKAAALSDEESPLAHRDRFYSYLQALLPGDEGLSAAEFLGEVIGLPASEAPSPRLIAARNDPRILGDRVQQAIVAWLGAECARQPLLLVLEDLHWADPGSVAQLEFALGSLTDRPLFVVALARPETRELFPRLWERAGVQELKLDPLTRRAAEKLVRAALGEGVDAEVVSRVVGRAGGNAFYLEELIRSAAEGRDELPETVVAMATSRFERLEPEARRVLRAASILGEVFWTGGVAALLGAGTNVGPWLDALADREVLDRSRESRFAGEREYAFRHALLRDAAYGTLTETDRRAGHGLAGEWLAQLHKIEPLAIAEHFEHAGKLEQAASWLVKAMSRALGGGTPASTLQLGDRAIAVGASGTERGVVRAVQSLASLTRGDASGMVEAGREAIRLLPVSRPEWFWAAGAIMVAALSSDDAALSSEILSAVMNLDVMPPATGPLGWAFSVLTWGAISFGRSELAVRVIERFEEAAEAARANGGALDPSFLGHQCVARYVVDVHVRDDVAAGLRAVRGAEPQYTLGGDFANVPHGITFTGTALFDAGNIEGALAHYDRAAPRYRELGNEYMLSYVLGMKAVALTAGPVDDRHEQLLPDLDARNIYDRGVAQIARAHFFLRRNDPDAAERSLPPVADVEKKSLPCFHRALVASHARVRLARGAAEEALALAERARRDQETSPMMPVHRSIVLLAHAESLGAAGGRAEAREAIRSARDRLRRMASGFEDSELAQSYVANLEPNARTLALAERWLDDG